MIVEAIWDAGGNMRRAAFILDLERTWLFRLIVRLNLRDELIRARTRAERPDWLINARKALSMDDRIQEIVAACEGKSADEIQELVEAAGDFEDPGLIAAYVAHLAGAA